MNADRELLERAARAYWGDALDDTVSIEWGDEDDCILYTDGANQDHNGRDRTLCWIPLDDDEDALRLVVKLRIDVFFDSIEGTVCARHADTFYGEYEELAPDARSATRRAIVRAAAATIKEPAE